MYMQVNIHDGDSDVVVEAFENFDEDHVLGYVHADGSDVDMSAFASPRIVYVTREVHETLPT